MQRKALADLVARGRAEGLAFDIVTGAGTGTFDLDSEGGPFTELQTGSYVSMDVDYLKALEDGKTGLIIAPTHAEGERLTEAVRDALKEKGALGKERLFMARRGVGWTQAQKGDIRNYEPGMIIEFQQNAKGFTRGEKAVVMRGKDGLALQKQNGRQAEDKL